MKNWQDIGFTIEWTADGSPSLRLLSSLNPAYQHGEAMHHSGGAASETQLIYGELIHLAFQQIKGPVGFTVVGLGLGYIELNIASYSLISGAKIGHILSYESVSELREAFIDWLYDRPLSAEIQMTYDEVWMSIQKQLPLELSLSDVKSVLKNYFKTVEDIQKDIKSETLPLKRSHCILYDAFSSKTSPHLWEEEFLVRFIDKGAEEKCLFATYSAKGNLKRALKFLGFELQKRDGFKSKRGSTRALRI